MSAGRTRCEPAATRALAAGDAAGAGMLIFTATFDAPPAGFDVAGVTGGEDVPPPLQDESASARTHETGLEKKRTPNPSATICGYPAPQRAVHANFTPVRLGRCRGRGVSGRTPPDPF